MIKRIKNNFQLRLKINTLQNEIDYLNEMIEELKVMKIDEVMQCRAELKKTKQQLRSSRTRVKNLREQNKELMDVN